MHNLLVKFNDLYPTIHDQLREKPSGTFCSWYVACCMKGVINVLQVYPALCLCSRVHSLNRIQAYSLLPTFVESKLDIILLMSNLLSRNVAISKYLYQCLDTNIEQITSTVHYSLHTVSYILRTKGSQMFRFLTAGHLIIIMITTKTSRFMVHVYTHIYTYSGTPLFRTPLEELKVSSFQG